ncbi:uncharacterized protein LOC117649597 [Thrips palmi]|uniref:Uncharacterized protein LOC117649597 n=1 Tax=Thrips palmi TaxID=161013 RepID=A0A6P8ZTH1_THRPL|nr:uncharacterized protein LOC117649597 [Thrips palmi]
MHYYVQLVVLASVVMEPLISSLVLVDVVLKVSVGETWMRWLWGPPPGDLSVLGAAFDQDRQDTDEDSEYTLSHSDSELTSSSASSWGLDSAVAEGILQSRGLYPAELALLFDGPAGRFN